MSKVYVVIEGAWEYNDEYYYRSCHGASNIGRPERVFTERNKATARARELDIREIRGCNLNDYSSNGMLEIIQEGKEEKLSQLIFGHPNHNWDEWSECKVPSSVSDEMADKILDCLNIGWYDVVEVNLDDD